MSLRARGFHDVGGFRFFFVGSFRKRYVRTRSLYEFQVEDLGPKNSAITHVIDVTGARVFGQKANDPKPKVREIWSDQTNGQRVLNGRDWLLELARIAAGIGE